MMVHSSRQEKSKITARKVPDDHYISLLSNDSSNHVAVCHQERALRANKVKSPGLEKPLCQQRRLSAEDIALRRGLWSSPSSPVVRRKDHSSSSRSNPKVQGSSSVSFSGAPPYSTDKIISPSCKRRTIDSLPSQTGHQQRDNMSCPTTPSTSRRYFPSISNSFHQHKRLQNVEHPVASDRPKLEGKILNVKETCPRSGELPDLQKPPKEENRQPRIRSTDSEPHKEDITHQPIVKEPTSRQNSNKNGREDGRSHLPIFPVWIERPNLNLERTPLPIKENLQMSKDQAHISKLVKHHSDDSPQRHSQAATRDDQVTTNQSKDNRGNKHANILPPNLPTSLRCLFKKTKPDNRSTPSTPEMKRRVRPTTGDNQRVPPSTHTRLSNARLTSSRSMVDLSSAPTDNGAVPPQAPASVSASPTAAFPGSRGTSEVEQIKLAFGPSLQVGNDLLSPPNQAAVTRSTSTIRDLASEPGSTPLSSFASDPFDDSCYPALPTECVVCMSSPVNAVIYTCGHMCMCHGCAVGIKASQSPKCPMCRAHIKDVIRVFTA